MASEGYRTFGLRSGSWLRVLGFRLATLTATAVLVSCGAADESSGVGEGGAQSGATEATQPALAEITTYAGTGSPKFQGDGGPAVESGFFAPQGLALDSQGNLYIATDNRIRRVDAATGVITTIAGIGKNRSEGDGGPAVNAVLAEPKGVSADGEGNLFILENRSGRVRKVEAATGIITTVAGGGIGDRLQGIYGDGGPATEALILAPDDVDVDGAGNLYIATEHRIRKVDAATGIITTIAGTGKQSMGGDEGPATSASLAEPRGVAVDGQGNIYIADTRNHRIRKIDATTGVITTITGLGNQVVEEETSSEPRECIPTFVFTVIGGYTDCVYPEGIDAGVGYQGDGGPATSALLTLPNSVAVDGEGNVYFVSVGIRVRRIDAATAIISTVALDEAKYSTSESGKIRVTTTIFGQLMDIAIGDDGAIFMADLKKNVVHKVAAPAAP